MTKASKPVQSIEILEHFWTGTGLGPFIFGAKDWIGLDLQTLDTKPLTGAPAMKTHKMFICCSSYSNNIPARLLR
ncbi:hypothetical protein M378DRAFT_15923 [Amanita muscaria Koide BX008]|uniref:Uncharacterized protein n=1 Tax=Amanita muscaria (strain Koide BX008) TaxID=946122 RepID=A0A0C2WMI4_AMAMK|nr:hypothetical protein M378DRAFT_15923 [Amanita muscaria Koide BX008]